FCCTPSRNCTFTLAPAANGVLRVIVPTAMVALNPPPIVCPGGCSSVVPCTVTVQGVVEGVPVEAHVAESLTVTPVTATEESTRKSAVLPDTGNVEMSITRNR